MTDEATTTDAAARQLVEIAMESWRFVRIVAKAIARMEPADEARYASQLRYFSKKVDESLSVVGVRMVSLEGQPFDEGMAVSALNLDEFGAEELLVVDQMIEPVLMGSDGVLRPGTVMVRRAATA